MTGWKNAGRRWGVAVVALALLAGCGNTPGMGTGLLASVAEVRAIRAAQPEQAQRLQPTAGFPGLDPALLGGRTDPMMGAYVESSGAVAGLIPAGPRGGAVATWMTADNISVSLLGGGVVVGTRGLGADLHLADVSQTAALVAAGRAGTAERRHVYLDPLYRETEVRLSCTLAPTGAEVLVLNGQRRPVQRFQEHCSGGGHQVTNTYWRDARGPTIRQSSQWLGPELGMIHLQRLND